MSAPAFQLIGDRFATSAFGTSAFGTSPFGGSAYEAYTLPTFHLGSDDLTQSYRKAAGEIVHVREGLPVSVRPYATVRRWAVNFAVIDATKIEDLQEFFSARTFKLLPSGDPDIYYTVRWVGTEFAPSLIRPGKYALSFEIEELL